MYHLIHPFFDSRLVIARFSPLTSDSLAALKNTPYMTLAEYNEVKTAAIHTAKHSIIHTFLLTQPNIIASLEYQPEDNGKATKEPEPIIKYTSSMERSPLPPIFELLCSCL